MNLIAKTLDQVAEFKNNAEKLIFIFSEKNLKKEAWKKSVPSAILQRLKKGIAKKISSDDPLKAGAQFLISGFEPGEPDLLIALLPEELTTFNLLGFARACLKLTLSVSTKNLGIICLEQEEEMRVADCFAAAAATRVFPLPEFGERAKKRKAYQLKAIHYFSATNQLESLRYGFESGEGANLVRHLGMLPPNVLNTESYGKKIKEISAQHRIKVKFYSNHELKRMGAGAFTAVDQGNPDSKGGIYELTYQPSRSKNKNFIALVGKGLCFDTGGYDIKTGGHMVTMKGDMIGSALAMSVLMTASRLNLPLKLKAFLGVTENHISPLAYKADEVVVALNGLSIEVINTDAEGRMVLADTLALASRSQPEMMLDFATLTGTATLAIGTSYSAGFTNRDDFHSRIVEAGRRSGERVWTFPMDKDFGKALESPIADFIQCTKGRSPDHILAAYFLSQFVGKDIPWVHIDLSAADHEGGLAHVDSLFTGFGVRWALEFLKTSFKL